LKIINGLLLDGEIYGDATSKENELWAHSYFSKGILPY